MTAGSHEWSLSHGPNRPVWEPVRLVDFDGRRRVALDELRAELRHEATRPDMSDERLALHAIIEVLCTQATVSGATGAAELTRLATQRLPAPQGRAKRRLTAARRDELIVVAGQMWQVFTRHNFPLPPAETE